ncbi:MAG: NAD(P)-dependent oxidoreductase [Pseudomonadota bacterium]|nr:NAD(P)-dependent oxidoreductase [Pseudomonadota bacterium]
MKILITGGTGFIGSHYVRYLSETRPDVKVFFSGRNLELGNQLAAATGAHYYRGDLQDVPLVKLICKDVDVVVHCAGRSGVWGEYVDYYHANVQSTEHVLAAAMDAGVQRFVNLGSPSVYFDFNDHLNVTEDFLPPRFADHYARTKYQAETRVMRAHSEQMKTLSLRPRFVVGPGDHSILPRLIRSHQAGRLTQVGEGRNIISMTSIGNLMLGLDCAVFGPDDVCGDVYNLSDPQAVNFWDLVNQLMPQVGLPTVTRKVTYGVAFTLASAVEAFYRLRRSEQEPDLMRHKVAVMGNSFTLNIERARRKLDYEPQTDIRETLAAFAQWWNSRSA